MTTKATLSRFNVSRIEGLRAGDHRRDHTDPAAKGLQLRVEPNGRKVWLFRFKWRGQTVRLTLGAFPGLSLHRARELAQEHRARLDQGIDPRRARSAGRIAPSPAPTSSLANGPHSIEFLAEEFLERFVRPNRRRPEDVERMLAKDVLSVWARRDARTITPREVIELLDGIVARGSKVMANRVASMLGQLFKFGIHRSIVEASPVQLLFRPGGKEKSRARAFSGDELKAFVMHVSEACKARHMSRVLMVLLLTGQRRSELALARWRNIDFKEKTWTIPDENSKSQRGHVVPLSAMAIAELQALKKLAGRSAYVLPNDDGTEAADPKLITRSVARCLARFKKFGVEAFTPHDLRRTCRTGMARLGIATEIAERVLNHAREKIEGTYDVHDYLKEKRAALDKWASHLEEMQDA